MPRSSGVSTVAGDTTFTVMPWRATSVASDFENPTSAALAPAYTASRGVPTRPASEAMLTMRPAFLGSIVPRAACVQLSAPRVVDRHDLHPGLGRARGEGLVRSPPGIVHEDIQPPERRHHLGRRRLHAGAVRHVRLEGERAAPTSPDLVRHLPRGHRVHVEERDVGARVGERQRDAAADALASARHDRGLAVEAHVPSGL